MKALLKAGTLALVIASLSLTSCGKEDIAAQSITIEKELEMYVDSTYQMKAEVVPANATGTVNWVVSDTAIATVSDAGVLKAHKKGTAVVTANVGNAVAVCNLTVHSNPVTLEMSVYEILQKKCTVTVKPSDQEGYYYCGYAPKADMKDVTDEQIATETLAYLQQMAQLYSQYYGQTITLKELLPNGTKNLIASPLTANTEYTLYAFGIDVETERASKTVTRLDVKTKEVVPSSITFTIELDSLKKNMKVSKGDTTYTYDGYFKCTPSNETETYAYEGITSIALDTAYNNDPMAYLAYVEAYCDKNSQGGYEGSRLRKGTMDLYFKTLVHKEKYTLIAAGYQGGFTTKATTFEYTFIHPDSVPKAIPMYRKPSKMNVAADEVLMPDKRFILVPGMCH